MPLTATSHGMGRPHLRILRVAACIAATAVVSGCSAGGPACTGVSKAGADTMASRVEGRLNELVIQESTLVGSLREQSRVGDPPDLLTTNTLAMIRGRKDSLRVVYSCLSEMSPEAGAR